jgi:nucleoside-diphosphate-sugar epimerase
LTHSGGREVDRAVLVTGATGAVGPALVERLARDGHRVRALSRTPRLTTDASPPVEWICGDVTDRASVARAVRGVKWVFHLAAHLHVPHPDGSQRSTYERVNVEGTRTVAEESASAGVSRLVFFSSVAVYGHTPSTVVDETTTPRPDTLYGETKLRAEERALGLTARDSGTPLACVLRLGAVYGPRMKGNYLRLAQAIRSGWFVPVGKGRNRRTLVHEADVAEAALLAAASPRAAGQVYNVTDGRLHRLDEIIEVMCAVLGRRPPRWSVPPRVARPLARLGDGALAVLFRRKGCLETVTKYTEDVAVSGEKIARELGYRPRVEIEEGFRDALSSLRSRA